MIFADLLVVLEEDRAAAERRWRHLDALDGAELRSDALVFNGSSTDLADLMVGWREVGIDGFRLRPAVLNLDLPAIVGGLVPDLQRRHLFRSSYESSTLRGHLGLTRPHNRYSQIRAASTRGTVPDGSPERVPAGGGGHR